MKSTSIIVAALLSALALPVFAQTGAPATPATPAAASAAPKAEKAATHKKVKHVAKKEKAATTPAAKPATEAAPAKAK